MPTYEQNIPAGQSIDFPGGEYFYLITADYNVVVTFYGEKNKIMDVWSGMKSGLRLAFRNKETGQVEPFVRVNIASATAQPVKVCVTSASGEYVKELAPLEIAGGTLDTVGVVSDISGGTLDTLTTINNVDYVNYILRDDSKNWDTDHERAFIGAYYNDPTNNAQIQLWNPATSGKNAHVRAIRAVSNVVALVQIRITGSPLSTNTGSVFNKKMGGAAPGCELRFYDGGLQGTLKSQIQVAANAWVDLLTADAILLAPNKDIIIACGGSGTPFAVEFEWQEEPT